LGRAIASCFRDAGVEKIRLTSGTFAATFFDTSFFLGAAFFATTTLFTAFLAAFLGVALDFGRAAFFALPADLDFAVGFLDLDVDFLFVLAIINPLQAFKKDAQKYGVDP